MSRERQFSIPRAWVVFLTYEVPLFADFKEFMKGNKPYNKTILSVVHDEGCVPRLCAILDEVCGGLGNPGTGILFTVPVDFAVGLVEQQVDRDERPVPQGGAHE